MKKKIWNKTVIASEVQDIQIYPTPEYDGIIVEIVQVGNKSLMSMSIMHLDKDEMEFLIIKMQEMMEYVLEK
jgi:hypothetical protein